MIYLFSLTFFHSSLPDLITVITTFNTPDLVYLCQSPPHANHHLTFTCPLPHLPTLTSLSLPLPVAPFTLITLISTCISPASFLITSSHAFVLSLTCLHLSLTFILTLPVLAIGPTHLPLTCAFAHHQHTFTCHFPYSHLIISTLEGKCVKIWSRFICGWDVMILVARERSGRCSNGFKYDKNLISRC